MAEPTQSLVNQLEDAMTNQFYFLVQGAAWRISLGKKYGADSKQFKDFTATFKPLVNKWILREVKYETPLVKKHIYGIIASGDLVAGDFFDDSKLPKLNFLVTKWNKDKQTTSGIGFIPLLIWAVIALVGFFTAKEITDDLTTTTQEKAALMKSTSDTAKELGLSPDQAAALLSQTQQEASAGSGLSDTLKWGAAALLLLMFGPKIIESLSHSNK